MRYSYFEQMILTVENISNSYVINWIWFYEEKKSLEFESIEFQ